MARQIMIYKRFDDVFKAGEMFRVLKTGEVLIYHSSTGGANFSSYVEVLLNNAFPVRFPTALRLHEVVKVDREGNFLDDFSHLVE